MALLWAGGFVIDLAAIEEPPIGQNPWAPAIALHFSVVQKIAAVARFLRPTRLRIGLAALEEPGPREAQCPIRSATIFHENCTA